MVQGLDQGQMAALLGVHYFTVHKALLRLHERWGLSRQEDLIACALRHGYISLEHLEKT